MKLYEIDSAIADVEQLLADGSIDEATASDSLAGLELAQRDKHIGIAGLIRNIEAEEVATADAAKRMAARSKRSKARREYLTEWLRSNMESHSIEEIRTPELVLRLKKNPHAVEIDAGAVIPAAYMVTKPAPPPAVDKAALKRAVKDEGVEIEGVRIVQRTRLEVKEG